MDLEKMTQKSIEALRDAQRVAQEYGNQQITQLHLLDSLITQEGGLNAELLQKMGVNVEGMRRELRSEIDRLPKIGGAVDPERLYVSREANEALEEAQAQAGKMKDEFVSVEHFMLALILKADRELKKLFASHHVTKDAFLKALKEVRGNQRVTGNNPEETYDVLKKYGQDLVALAREQKLDPVIGRDDEIRNVIRILSPRRRTIPV
jgi:ATP-dependent Clp protease ATP-binding subunit ClpB